MWEGRAKRKGYSFLFKSNSNVCVKRSEKIPYIVPLLFSDMMSPQSLAVEFKEGKN
jgi:hypothetical protein